MAGVKRLWPMEEKEDISNLPAIRWGNEHESDAILDFENEEGGKVVKCGIFIHRKFPFLGASPDGIWKDSLIEVKCPYSLRNTFPWDLGSLRPVQRRNHFQEKIGNNVSLKDTHAYYYQCQLQMFCTGYRNTKFIV